MVPVGVGASVGWLVDGSLDVEIVFASLEDAVEVDMLVAATVTADEVLLLVWSPNVLVSEVIVLVGMTPLLVVVLVGSLTLGEVDTRIVVSDASDVVVVPWSLVVVLCELEACVEVMVLEEIVVNVVEDDMSEVELLKESAGVNVLSAAVEVLVESTLLEVLSAKVVVTVMSDNELLIGSLEVLSILLVAVAELMSLDVLDTRLTVTLVVASREVLEVVDETGSVVDSTDENVVEVAAEVVVIISDVEETADGVTVTLSTEEVVVGTG